MADKKVIRFRGTTEELIDVEIDVDTCTILDIYLDLFKLSSTNPRFLIPTRPCICYDTYEGGYDLTRKWVHNDSDLMEMLNHYRDHRVIEISLGSTKKPSEGMLLARRLYMGKNNPFAGGLSKSPLKEPPDAISAEAPPNEPPPTPPQVNSIPCEVSEYQPQESQPQVNASPFPAPPTDPLPAPPTAPLPAPPTAPPTDPFLAPPTAPPTGPPVRNGRKLPASTAKDLGLPYTRVGSSSTRKRPAERQSRTRTTASTNVLSIEGEDLLDSESDDTNYEPEDSEDVDCGDSEVELEDESSYDLHSAHDNLFVDEYPEKASWDDFDEGEMSSIYRNGILYEEPEDGVIQLMPWMLFHDKAHFMEVFVDYCVQQGFSVITLWSDKKRCAVECAAEGCEWRLSSSKLVDDVTWAIKHISSAEHTCARLQDHNPMASVEWAVRQLIGDVRANPDLSAVALNNILFERFGVKLKRSSLYKMREEVLRKAEGSHDTSYAKLPAYCDTVRATNPGSVAEFVSKVSAVIPTEPIVLFHHIFISIHACIEGVIRGARPLIGVDGTHLKGHYGGVLLSAVALDGNNEIFPLAYAIVQSETKQTWRYFFSRLKDILAPTGRQDWTIICDRQKSVEPALREIWPAAGRRFCCRHLCMNFRKKFTGPKMYASFWKVVNAYSEFTFKKALTSADKAAEQLKPGYPNRASKWLHKQGPVSCWSRHAFNPSVCADTNTSNFVESFNASLGNSRNKPVLTMLEDLRRTCMDRNCSRAEAAERWDPNGLTPYAMKMLRDADVDSKCCKVYKSTNAEFEIRDGRSYLPVSVNGRTCACGVWQISGIPCKHAVRALNHMRARLRDYVSPYYSVRTYKIMYGLPIKPVPDPDQWSAQDQPNIRPPALKRGVGRPPKNRRREAGEKRKAKRSSTIRCGKCKQFGHNARTCKGGLTARQQRDIQAGEGPSSPPEDTVTTGEAESSDNGSSDEGDFGLDSEFMSSAPWRAGP